MSTVGGVTLGTSVGMSIGTAVDAARQGHPIRRKGMEAQLGNNVWLVVEGPVILVDGPGCRTLWEPTVADIMALDWEIGQGTGREVRELGPLEELEVQSGTTTSGDSTGICAAEKVVNSAEQLALIEQAIAVL